ncbi:uncharacterized protein LOC110225646 [Arabidopsis lyrata subsp. lyrata]|nr:uncharacterized protein LOC110225646 [Arabidopsis lyrata subsp. lyrata]|eukprot:XP_020871121.1 uncharacterized protein LOC110225646 [Arabidopsis lyrata subsp. lyrata]
MKVPCDPLYNAPERSHGGGETHPKPRDKESLLKKGRRSRSTMVKFFI